MFNGLDSIKTGLGSIGGGEGGRGEADLVSKGEEGGGID